MEIGDKFITDKEIILVLEKYDKDGDALFTSPNMELKKMDGIEEGYMCFPVHICEMLIRDGSFTKYVE